MTVFKLITHDYRPPIQGGDPVWDGHTLPFQLPRVTLDTSDADCGSGWCAFDVGGKKGYIRAGSLWGAVE